MINQHNKHDPQSELWHYDSS